MNTLLIRLQAFISFNWMNYLLTRDNIFVTMCFMDTQIEESIAGRKANNEAFYSALKEYKAYGRRGLASMDLEGLVDELVRRFPMTHTCADCGARYTEDEPERYAFLCFSCASHQYE